MNGAGKLSATKVLGLVLGFAVLVAVAFGRDGGALAQLSQPNSAGQTSSRPVRVSPPDMDDTLTGDLSNPVYQQRRLRQLNLAQHKQLVSDTEKLVKLVAELNEEINKTAPADLTPDQLRKIAEIEKLAHSVKDKMRTSMQAAPGFSDGGPNAPFAPVHH